METVRRGDTRGDILSKIAIQYWFRPSGVTTTALVMKRVQHLPDRLCLIYSYILRT